MDHNHRARGRSGLIFASTTRPASQCCPRGSGSPRRRMRSATRSTSGRPSLPRPWRAGRSTTSSATRRSSTPRSRSSSWPGSSTRCPSTSSASASPPTSAPSSSRGSKRLVELADRGQRAPGRGAVLVQGEGNDERPGRRRGHGGRGRPGRRRRHHARGRRAGRLRGALPSALHAPDDLARCPAGRVLGAGPPLEIDACPLPRSQPPYVTTPPAP